MDTNLLLLTVITYYYQLFLIELADPTDQRQNTEKYSQDAKASTTPR